MVREKMVTVEEMVIASVLDPVMSRSSPAAGIVADTQVAADSQAPPLLPLSVTVAALTGRYDRSRKPITRNKFFTGMSVSLITLLTGNSSFTSSDRFGLLQCYTGY
jgi:hypothetical protein